MHRVPLGYAGAGRRAAPVVVPAPEVPASVVVDAARRARALDPSFVGELTRRVADRLAPSPT